MLLRETSPGIRIGSRDTSPMRSSDDSGQTSLSSGKWRQPNAAGGSGNGGGGASAHADPREMEGLRNGISSSQNGPRYAPPRETFAASRSRAAPPSTSGVAARPSLSVPRLHLSTGPVRPGAAAAPTRFVASTPPPSLPLARTSSYSVPHTPSASFARSSMTSAMTRKAGGRNGSRAFLPAVASAAPNYAAYPLDISKYLKELVRRRDEAMMLRLLPTAQLLDQTVLQAQAAQELLLQQEALEFMQIAHKKVEAERRFLEQTSTKANRQRMEQQKWQHREEMAQMKSDVAAMTRETEMEIKDKLRILLSLQPKLSILPTILVQLQDSASDCAILGALLMEDKQLQRALKADARFKQSRTAEVDGGAEPYWWRQCVCASFNVAAILKNEPYRASVMDAPAAGKSAADKKVVVVRDGEGRVVAWAHTRCGPEPAALAEAYLATKGDLSELPMAACKGVLWPKEDAAEVLRKARVLRSPIAAIAPEVLSILHYHEIGSHELSRRDILAAGEAASA